MAVNPLAVLSTVSRLEEIIAHQEEIIATLTEENRALTTQVATSATP